MMKTSFREYFDGQARSYRERSERFPWRMLRERERRAVMELLQPEPGDRILDAGCGAGFYALQCRAGGAEVMGVDASAAMVAQTRRAGIEAEETALEELSLERRFTKILCAGALEFANDVPAILGRFLRHLEPGGLLVTLTPPSSLGGRVYQWFHRRHGVEIQLFEPSRLERMLGEAGFRVRESRRAHPFALVTAAAKEAS